MIAVICSLSTSRFDIFLCIEPRSECVVDSGCPGHQACLHQKCKNICHTTTCGSNAECEAKNHHAVCKCASGFVGNPYKVCEKGMTISIWQRFLSNDFNVTSNQLVLVHIHLSVCHDTRDDCASFLIPNLGCANSDVMSWCRRSCNLCRVKGEDSNVIVVESKVRIAI